MVNIEKLLIDFLEKKGTLPLPQMGVLSYSYQSAEVFRYTKRILPPRYKINFVPSTTEASNDLVSYIADKLQISEEEAQEKLNSFIKKIKDKLDTQQSFYWAQIGTFSIKENVINFEEDKDSLLLANNLGLKDVELPINEPIVVEKDTNKKVEVTSQVSKIKTKKTFPGFVKLGLSLATLILIFFLLVVPNVSNRQIDEMHSFISEMIKKIEEVVKGKQKMYDIENIRQINREALAIDTFAIKREEKDTLIQQADIIEKKEAVVGQPQLRYYIIAGSFKSKENAIRCVNELKEKGYDANILTFGDSLFRVYIFSSIQRQQAVEEFISISQQDPQLKIWFYSRYE